ncbi:cell division protein [Gottschalkia acidurici 9a]|uniref:Cell division protein n=1 Tax=Gottschalkia acidurici (strain ATCC 7906 / DSM 604 / BCRC 14475 / CIP 104303 / KCTC 5404 / NCIMB 10678 / 9a) TaxID=1128398 RepID=K0B0Y5_GOTA9|nr:septum formation initiator family protein [Gottschalkia acidurici]AFS78306.1 cell division protein [Gottschalkia acidurici 9a]
MVLAKREKKTYPKKTKKNKKKEKQKKKIDAKVKIKLSILSYAVIFACSCIFLLSRYAHITEVQMQVDKINREISELEEENHVLMLKLEEIKDSGWIEEQAKVRMNMRKANSDQIVYLNVK